MPNRMSGESFWFEKYPAIEGTGSHVSSDYDIQAAIEEYYSMLEDAK